MSSWPIKKSLPRALLDRCRHLKEEWRQRRRSCEEAFTEVYEQNRWGGRLGEYCSGAGSSEEAIVGPYIEAVSREAAAEGFRGSRFVDLGCGDFQVGTRLLDLCSTYTGADVVKALIERNQRHHGGDRVRFLHLDMVRDDLPDGDVCFVRQVFQHLSNRQIGVVLPKLHKYRWVFITEHYPDDNPAIEPNKDIVHGGSLRIFVNSGVYLDRPPFNLPASKLREVLSLSKITTPAGSIPGVIRTFLYKPGD